MPTLLLVDGSSYLYRAFHAMPELTTSQGEPSGAMYGVLNMLRRLEADFKAEDIAYKACVFDAKGKTFRDDWYPAYKANRPSMPEALRSQIAPIHEAIAALGWPLLSIEGVEADDVIGTLSDQACRLGHKVIISTGDKDMAQLVNPSVRLVNTMSNEMLDEAGVLEKFGVPPHLIVDYLTLMGDTADNVPGVPKVGPKTAVKWLTQYGSLDEVIAKADEISGVVGQNLRDTLSFLPLGKKLVTICCDVPLPTSFEDLNPKEKDEETLLSIFTRFEMRSWQKEVLERRSDASKTRLQRPALAQSIESPEAQIEATSLLKSDLDTSRYETILTHDALSSWLAKLQTAPLVALDLETTSLNTQEAKIVGISFAVEKGLAAYVPLAHDYAGAPAQLPRDDVLNMLKPWLESDTQLKIGQNLTFDQHIFANHGIAFKGIAHDTLLASYVLDAGREEARAHDLGALAKRHLGFETVSYESLCGKGAHEIPFSQVVIERAAHYGAEDADLCLYLHELFAARLAKNEGQQFVYEHIEMPVREVIFQMERAGCLIDEAALAKQSHEIGTRILALEKEAHLLAGHPFNLNSPKQLAAILFDEQKLPIKKKTPSGTPSTDEEVLSELALHYPLPKVLLETRTLTKLKGTYTDKLPRMIAPTTGRVHTHYAQAVAVTGRLTSSDPNLQNIPIRTEAGRKIRQAFIARKGASLLAADYSQIELRIMAHLSEDERLLAAFAADEDVHAATASEIFSIPLQEVLPNQRRIAKTINFGLIYGMSAFGLARALEIERSAAQTYIERYFARYTGVARYMAETKQKAMTQGFVETLFGRRLYLTDLAAKNAGKRQGAERAAINAPMQGTAADLIKLAMIAVQHFLDENKLKSRLILQVHDELVMEVPHEEIAVIEEALPKLMGSVGHLKVPLLVEIGMGQNWDEAH